MFYKGKLYNFVNQTRDGQFTCYRNNDDPTDEIVISDKKVKKLRLKDNWKKIKENWNGR